MLKLTFCILCAFTLYSANAQETSKDGKPFFSDKERGWFWHEDPEPEETIAPLPQAQTSPQTQSDTKPPEVIPLDAKWLRKNLDNIVLQAMSDPTDTNLANMAYAQRLMLDMGSRFSSKMTDYMMGQPMLDEANRRPNSAFALNEFKAEQSDVIKEVIEDIKGKTQGLWFFYASTCSYCKKMLPVIKRFKENYNIDILAISLDGGALEGMEGLKTVIDYNHDVSKRFNVTLTPTTYLVLNNNDAKLVAEGMRSLPELENKLLRTARINNVISDEQYAQTRSVYELNMFNNKEGQLFVDKTKLESDPNYLAEALKKQLEDVKPFGTRVVN